MILLLLLNMLLASTFTIGKAALTYVQPIFLIGVRMIIAGTILLLYQFFSDVRSLKIHKKHLAWFLAAVFIHIYIPFVFEFWAMQYISSAKTSLLYSLTPFITALFAYFAFHETLSKKKWLGLLIGFVGFVPILLTQDLSDAMGSFFFLSPAEMVLLISITSAALGWLLMKKLMHYGYSPVVINGVTMFSAGIVSLATSFVLEKNPLIPAVPQKMLGVGACLESVLGSFFSMQHVDVILFVFYMLLLVFIANIVCYNMYGYLLRRHSATLISFSGLTIPIFGAVFGWFFLGEHIPWQFVVSTIVICAGLYIFYQEDLRLKKLV